MVVRHSALLGKLALHVEDFYVKTIWWGLKNHVFDHETRESGLFPCYRLKINEFLSSYNKISKSTFSHPCSKFLATAKVGLAHYDSFRGGGSHICTDRQVSGVTHGQFSGWLTQCHYTVTGGCSKFDLQRFSGAARSIGRPTMKFASTTSGTATKINISRLNKVQNMAL